MSFGLLLSGCRQTPKLKLTDLKFGDVEKEQLAANRVDSVFLISKNRIFYGGWSDTIGYRTYDKRGNLLTDYEQSYWSRKRQYQYDSNDLVIYSKDMTDVKLEFQVRYKFLPDSLLLYRFRKELLRHPSADSLLFADLLIADTCKFKFDAIGNVVKSTESYMGEKENETSYEYNLSGQLLKEISTEYRSLQQDSKQTIIYHY